MAVMAEVVTGLSQQKPRFMLRLVHVGLDVDKVAMGQIFL
jgi:hypothetical protein